MNKRLRCWMFYIQTTRTMKKLLTMNRMSAPWTFLGLILFVISVVCEAQSENDYKVSRIKQYNAKIILTNGQKIKGKLMYATDNSILLDEIVYKKSHGVRPEDITLLNNEVHYKDIESIRIRSLGSTLGGIALGTTAGVVMGSVTGFVDCEDCDWSEARDNNFFC